MARNAHVWTSCPREVAHVPILSRNRGNAIATRTNRQVAPLVGTSPGTSTGPALSASGGPTTARKACARFWDRRPGPAIQSPVLLRPLTQVAQFRRRMGLAGAPGAIPARSPHYICGGRYSDGRPAARAYWAKIWRRRFCELIHYGSLPPCGTSLSQIWSRSSGPVADLSHIVIWKPAPKRATGAARMAQRISQQLREIITPKDRQIAQLETRNSQLEARLAQLEEQNARLEARIV